MAFSFLHSCSNLLWDHIHRAYDAQYGMQPICSAAARIRKWLLVGGR
jgi:hypothetical protein